MANITDSFAEWLEDEGFGTIGTDLVVGGAPQDAPNKLMWLLSGGGGASLKTIGTQKIKQYTISVYYRNTDQEDVYEVLQELEETINSAGCIELDGYDVIEIEATGFPADQDLDAEDRTIGIVIVNLTTYL